MFVVIMCSDLIMIFLDDDVLVYVYCWMLDVD